MRPRCRFSPVTRHNMRVGLPPPILSPDASYTASILIECLIGYFVVAAASHALPTYSLEFSVSLYPCEKELADDAFWRHVFQVTGAVFGLGASLITLRGLWAAAGIIPPPPPPGVVSDEEEGGHEEKEAKAMVEDAKPYSVELEMEDSIPTSSYVEVKGTRV